MSTPQPREGRSEQSTSDRSFHTLHSADPDYPHEQHQIITLYNLGINIKEMYVLMHSTNTTYSYTLVGQITNDILRDAGSVCSCYWLNILIDSGIRQYPLQICIDHVDLYRFPIFQFSIN